MAKNNLIHYKTMADENSLSSLPLESQFLYTSFMNDVSNMTRDQLMEQVGHVLLHHLAYKQTVTQIMKGHLKGQIDGN